MYSVQVDDFEQWRKTARRFLQRGITPEDIHWGTAQQASLFSAGPNEDHQSLPVRYQELKIPKKFYPLADSVSCFRGERKWSLLYRVAWRLIFENRRLLNCPVDEDISQLISMQKAVNRDRHKMAAFVRFKRVDCIDSMGHSVTGKLKLAGENPEHGIRNMDSSAKNLEIMEIMEIMESYVAWFEPQHLIVRSKAPFFVERFNNMRWSILTPDICAHWDLETLHFTEGLGRQPAIKDELEQLWLTYYRHIFNPARLKLKAMQSEMPKKYWANLPEASLILELSRNAQSQTETMIDQKAPQAGKKIPICPPRSKNTAK